MNFKIRRGPLTLGAAVLSLAAILASSPCFAHGDGDAPDILPVLGESLPSNDNPPPFLTQGLAVTGYDSRPGAPYTVYLDFGGFAFSGTWATSGKSPGNIPAYTLDGDASTFNSTESDNIKIMWSRVAEKYSGFDINVTTVDPAVAAGQAGSDAQRLAFYDNTPKLMHTIIGGNGSWYGSGGGVSYVGKTAFAQTGSNGYHTDFVFAAARTNLRAISEAAAHEQGHGLNLNHQSDQSPFNEYNEGTGTGTGSKAPIMGKSYNSERGLWKIGYTSAGGTQNDLITIMNSNSNPGLAPFIDDGIGHTLLTATPLPAIGSLVNYNVAKGVIVPSSSFPATTTGAATYQSDFWSFSTDGLPLSLTVVAGRESITAGIADPGPMLDTSLEILNTSGTVLFSSATSSLNESLTVTLPSGDYIAHVMSAADPTGSGYFDIGSYFLTGNFSIPEPSSLALLIVAATWIGTIRRKRID